VIGGENEDWPVPRDDEGNLFYDRDLNWGV
jgi:hypothetical protein